MDKKSNKEDKAEKKQQDRLNREGGDAAQEERSNHSAPFSEGQVLDEEVWDEELDYELEMMRPPRGPTAAQIEEENRILLQKQRNFRLVAEVVSVAFAQSPAVEKVVLFRSVAVPLKKEVPRVREFRRYHIALWHECSDIDLAVWMNDLTTLRNLQRARSRALNELYQQRQIGVAHHQVEVFIMEPETGKYLGRLCHFTRCPRDKLEYLVPGCGAVHLLQQHAGFVFSPDALGEEKTIILWERPGKARFKEDNDVALA